MHLVHIQRAEPDSRLEVAMASCVLWTAIESQFTALLEQTEKEDSVPQAVRHYVHEMTELTDLAKERLEQVKV